MQTDPSYYWTDDDLLAGYEAVLAPEAVTYRPIGRVRVEHKGPTAHASPADRESRIVLDPDVADGLNGVTAGDRLTVVFHLDRSRRGPMVQHPRGDASRPKRGVFALRTPRRPNPIGITVVEVLGIEGCEVRVKGLDALDGTPVLDLKPMMEDEL